MTALFDPDVLSYNPWGFDESPYRVLRNVMATTRKPHDCAMCFEFIPSGTRVRAQSEVMEGKAATFHFCPLCCVAMARLRSDDPDGLEIERRMSLGQANAQAKRGCATEAP
jgi:hypothetical protein